MFVVYTCMRGLGSCGPSSGNCGRLGQDGVSAANEGLTTGVKGIRITISISHDTSKEAHGEFLWAGREKGSWVNQF